jgi:hypothetical protein
VVAAMTIEFIVLRRRSVIIESMDAVMAGLVPAIHLGKRK